jgi:hypothetical protein
MLPQPKKDAPSRIIAANSDVNARAAYLVDPIKEFGLRHLALARIAGHEEGRIALDHRSDDARVPSCPKDEGAISHLCDP